MSDFDNPGLVGQALHFAYSTSGQPVETRTGAISLTRDVVDASHALTGAIGPVGQAYASKVNPIVAIGAGVARVGLAYNNEGLPGAAYEAGRVSSEEIGTIAGTTAGARIGAMFGGFVGSFFAGVGSVPGTAIGTIFGGVIGALGGSTALGRVYDAIYSPTSNTTAQRNLQEQFLAANHLRSAPYYDSPEEKMERAIVAGNTEAAARAAMLIQGGSLNIQPGEDGLVDLADVGMYGDGILRAGAGYEGATLSRDGPDLTPQYARQIGTDAYVRDQQLVAARADASANGHHPDSGGGVEAGWAANTSGGASNTVTDKTTSQTTYPFSGKTQTATSVTGGTTAYPANGGGTTPTYVSGTGYVGDHPGASKAVTKPSVPAYGGGRPILLDLNGNGAQITDLSKSTQFIDAGNDGLKHRTAWAAAGDGVLFYDADNDNTISQTREYVFTEWDPTAKSDMQALRARFDSNNDGKLTADDAAFAQFKVMVTQADGSQVAQGLTQLGITEIRLTEDATQISLADGSMIDGQSTFVMNGVTGTVASAVLMAEVQDYRVVKTVSLSGTDREQSQTDNNQTFDLQESTVHRSPPNAARDHSSCSLTAKIQNSSWV